MKIKIIGAGIIGLTTAVHLAELGHELVVIAEHFSPNTISNKAAAIWFPFKAEPKKKVVEWSKQTFSKLAEFAKDEKSGVDLVDLIVFSDKLAYEKEWWEDALPENALINFNIRPHAKEYTSFYMLKAPFLEPQIHLGYLLNALRKSKKCRFEERRITCLEKESTGCDVLINCTGYGAKQLLNDQDLIPVKGQIVVLENDGFSCFYIDDVVETEMAYIFTRKDSIILGGTAEEGVENEFVDEEESKKILDRCIALSPELADKKIQNHYAGLRPVRKEIRLEWSENKRILHNYGHGGAGFTLAWGCAFEVANLIKELG